MSTFRKTPRSGIVNDMGVAITHVDRFHIRYSLNDRWVELPADSWAGNIGINIAIKVSSPVSWVTAAGPLRPMTADEKNRMMRDLTDAYTHTGWKVALD